MTHRTARRPLAFLAGTLLLGSALVAVGSPVAAAPLLTTTTYSQPGTYTYTVPQGATTLSIEVTGAAGGNFAENGGGGGTGGIVGGVLSVSAGQQFTVVVGGKGTAYVRDDPSNLPAPHHHFTMGGYNGGGNGGVMWGAGGGGASDIRTTANDLSSRLLVGAGGGGGTVQSRGGNAGGFGDGRPGYCTEFASPGTQTGGGQGLRCGNARDGANGVFGRGGDGAATADTPYTAENKDSAVGGGGGGGGWYGGGGGGAARTLADLRNIAGAGGSNHVAPGIFASFSGIASTSTGDGYVKIEPRGGRKTTTCSGTRCLSPVGR